MSQFSRIPGSYQFSKISPDIDPVYLTFAALQAKYAFIQNILMPLSDRLNKDNE